MRFANKYLKHNFQNFYQDSEKMHLFWSFWKYLKPLEKDELKLTQKIRFIINANTLANNKELLKVLKCNKELSQAVFYFFSEDTINNSKIVSIKDARFVINKDIPLKYNLLQELRELVPYYPYIFQNPIYIEVTNDKITDIS